MQRSKTRSFWRQSLLAAVVTLVSIACDSDEAAPMECPLAPRSDVEYIDALVPHHRMAISMADEVLERGDSLAVREMAQRIKDDQLEEIVLMEGLRSKLTETEAPPAEMDPHMMADLEAMQRLEGPELDERFLNDMIPHHAGAVELSHRALPNLDSPELRMLAETTIAKQTREMNEMLDALER